MEADKLEIKKLGNTDLFIYVRNILILALSEDLKIMDIKICITCLDELQEREVKAREKLETLERILKESVDEVEIKQLTAEEAAEGWE